MNHLAHLFLSGSIPEILIGNFITDFLLPKEQRALPAPLQEGLRLHLYIDQCIDNHPIFKDSIALIRTTQGKYAPVVADIYYDYLFVEEWERYCTIPYSLFKSNIYTVLSTYENFDFPQHVKHRVARMLQNDFLRSYQNNSHIPNTFMYLKKRAKFENKFETAHEDYFMFHDELQLHFNLVFPNMLTAIEQFGINLQNLRKW